MNEENSYSELGRASRAPGWVTNASFHGGFGLINAFGVPKPSFRVYELLHRAGDMQLAVTHTAASSYCNVTTGMIATTWNGTVQLLLYNHREWDATTRPPEPISAMRCHGRAGRRCSNSAEQCYRASHRPGTHQSTKEVDRTWHAGLSFSRRAHADHGGERDDAGDDRNGGRPDEAGAEAHARAPQCTRCDVRTLDRPGDSCRYKQLYCI